MILIFAKINVREILSRREFLYKLHKGIIKKAKLNVHNIKGVYSKLQKIQQP